MKRNRRITRSLYYRTLFFRHRKDIHTLWTLLADAPSKATFKGLLASYCTICHTPAYYYQKCAAAPCTQYHFTTEDGYQVYGTENPYFLAELFDFSKEMVLLDGGAYIGDTMELVHAVLDTQCRYVHAFEPNQINFQVAEQVMARMPWQGTCYR